MSNPSCVRDEIVQHGNSVYQHGPVSDRVYLMHAAQEDMPGLIQTLEALGQEKGYGKLFFKLPSIWQQEMEQRGYTVEAFIPGYYADDIDAHFYVRYLKPERADEPQMDEITSIREAACARSPRDVSVPAGIQLGGCTPGDVTDMARLYGQVFASYPFPIDDVGYLQETMASHVQYYGAWRDGELLALASAETDDTYGAAECTDFATAPKARGMGLARVLLAKLEDSCVAQKYRTLYTIARAISPGMNYVFADLGYTYTGTLIQNTNIGGQIETMQIWSKSISTSSEFT